MKPEYAGREQTLAKHFILEKYLQSLTFKLLLGGYSTLTYVDGFSGPWESRTDDYSDTSFMIAIRVLKDAQAQLRAQGKNKTIRCFFVEEKAKAYAQLHAAVMQHHDPARGFYVYTFHGKFEDAVDEIVKVVGTSFALTFIDPTGWTGYEFDKIARIMQHQPGEVLLNYMFDFINRFTAWDDVKITASFDGILGKDWRSRLDSTLARHEAVQALFAEELRKAGKFGHVLSTPIAKLSDRQHFSIVYGTRNAEGLATYREVEFSAMKAHGMHRHEAKQAMREAATGQADIFAMAGLQPPPPIETQVKGYRREARVWLLDQLRTQGRAFPFSAVWQAMIETFMLRRTDARQVCAELAKEGLIANTWRVNGSRKSTPGDDDIIGLTPPSITPGSDTATVAG
ncbi:three-Cys-motif partner protein TcmP [Aminobacter sp. LjRoot7]|uniref:three-Cys-motif partner protein TcmP n=1 Tax=Aminobacter sp. LjRoot7 TaxID=3342335 RepID=UPI003ECEDFEC